MYFCLATGTSIGLQDIPSELSQYSQVVAKRLAIPRMKERTNDFSFAWEMEILFRIRHTGATLSSSFPTSVLRLSKISFVTAACVLTLSNS